MDMPLRISTPAEACTWLERQTGRQWQESELFDAAVRFGMTMTAAPPLTACASKLEFVTPIDTSKYPTGFRKLWPLGWRMARLYPCHIFQVWTLGETETVHAASVDESNNHQVWFDEPVRVTRDQVRISDESLLNLLAKLNRRRDLIPFPSDSCQAAMGCQQEAIGVPTKKIIECFGLEEKWIEKLRRKNRSRQYDRARRQSGARGPGKSQTWNPAVFGALLIINGELTYNSGKVETIIKKYFTNYLDEWEAERQDMD